MNWVHMELQIKKEELERQIAELEVNEEKDENNDENNEEYLINI